MAFDKKLLDVLACPACKGKLIPHEFEGKEVLVCKFDRLAYPIEEGIPVLLESDAKQLVVDELPK